MAQATLDLPDGAEMRTVTKRRYPSTVRLRAPCRVGDEEGGMTAVCAACGQPLLERCLVLGEHSGWVRVSRPDCAALWCTKGNPVFRPARRPPRRCSCRQTPKLAAASSDGSGRRSAPIGVVLRQPSSLDCHVIGTNRIADVLLGRRVVLAPATASEAEGACRAVVRSAAVRALG